MNQQQVAQSLRFEDVRLSITSTRGTAHLLRGVTLEAHPGEVVAIVGESGSGKSTLLRSTVRLAPPGGKLTGSIRFGDSDVLDMSDADVRRFRASECRSVFQDPWAALHPLHTIRRQLLESYLAAHPGASKTVALERAIATLSSVGIPDPEARLGSYPHELSGGQLQRVVIAMGLLASAKVLICDEVTTALDATTQATVLELLRNLANDSELIVLLATHDLPMLRGVADKIVVMYAGRVVEVGPALDILDSPAHPYTRALLNASPTLETDSELEPIPGLAPSPLEQHEGCAFAPRCQSAVEGCFLASPKLYNVEAERDDRSASCFITTPAGREELPSESEVL